MIKILVASSIDGTAIERLQERYKVVFAFDASEAELIALIDDCDVLVFRSGVQITGEVLRSAPRLKLLVRAGSGLDNLDLACAQSRGLRLVRIPEPSAQAVAELSFALMLMLARQVRRADRLLRKGHWVKHDLTGYLLTGKRLGIVGTGNIGSRVGEMGTAWGMEVIGCVEYPARENIARLKAANIRLATLEEVLATADFVTVHVPLQDSTRGLIDAAALSRMKPGAFLVNLARGGVLDEHALYRELVTKDRLGGAALDVHAKEGEGKISPLVGLENVVLTPHIGATTIDSQRQIGHRIVEILDDAAANWKALTEATDIAGPNLMKISNKSNFG